MPRGYDDSIALVRDAVCGDMSLMKSRMRGSSQALIHFSNLIEGEARKAEHFSIIALG